MNTVLSWVAVVGAVCALVTSNAHADLRSMPMDSFIRQSDVIAFARVVDAHADGAGPGSAVLAVERVVKGTYSGQTVQVTWATEVHDQKIEASHPQWLLFLKRTPEGALVGTAYGRSYWPVQVDEARGARCTRFVIYKYPINMVSVEPKSGWRELVSRRRSPAGTQVPIICLDDVERLLNPDRKVTK